MLPGDSQTKLLDAGVLKGDAITEPHDAWVLVGNVRTKPLSEGLVGKFCSSVQAASAAKSSIKCMKMYCCKSACCMLYALALLVGS